MYIYTLLKRGIKHHHHLHHLRVMISIVLLALVGCVFGQPGVPSRTAKWFDEGRFGIFIHYGPYTIPGWAPLTDPSAPITAVDILSDPSPRLKENPYAEWAWNTMNIVNSSTAEYIARVWGSSINYDDFLPLFNAATFAKQIPAVSTIDAIVASGAAYAVLTTKHHDGVTMWPSSTPNPFKGVSWRADKNIVKKYVDTFRAKNLKVGLYYSGGFDWTFNGANITTLSEGLNHVPQTPRYTAYVKAHFSELIQNFSPDYLWNDIGLPSSFDMAAFLTEYQNAVPSGFINDRYSQSVNGRALYGNTATDVLLARQYVLGDKFNVLSLEYKESYPFSPYRWEADVAIGYSFGYNRNENGQQAHILSAERIITFLIQAASNNGNLLLGISVMANGELPVYQLNILRKVGTYMKTYGPAIQNVTFCSDTALGLISNPCVVSTITDDMYISVTNRTALASTDNKLCYSAGTGVFERLNRNFIVVTSLVTSKVVYFTFLKWSTQQICIDLSRELSYTTTPITLKISSMF